MAVGSVAGGPRRLGVGGRPGDGQEHRLGGALGVVGHLDGQVPAGRRQGPAEDRWVGGTRPAASQKEHGVIGGLGPVDGQAVERGGHRPLQQPGSGGRIDGRVGGEHGEHGGHVGFEHGRSLGHPAHREPLAVHLGVLGDGVSGHDGLGSGLAARRIQGVGDPADPSGDGLHGQRVADPSGRADQYLIGGTAQRLGGDLAHPLSVGQSGGPRGRVGVAAIEDHSGGPAAGGQEVVPTYLHRRGGHPVGGKDTGRGDR